MNKSERIFTKKDVIIFFIISILLTILYLAWASQDTANIWALILRLIPIFLFFYIPPVLVVILNLIFKLANIENEKIIKITKIIFFPIIFLLMFFEGVLTVLLIL